MSKRSKQAKQNEKRAYYGRNILHSIILLATNEISGVVELAGKCIRFEENDGELSISVNLSLKYGHTASEVAFRVQENIKRSIETMTAYRIKNIDINVLNVVLDETD